MKLTNNMALPSRRPGVYKPRTKLKAEVDKLTKEVNNPLFKSLTVYQQKQMKSKLERITLEYCSRR